MIARISGNSTPIFGAEIAKNLALIPLLREVHAAHESTRHARTAVPAV